MPSVQIKRGTKAQVDAAATANQLKAGEPYLLTDKNLLAIGTGTSTYFLAQKVNVVANFSDLPAANSVVAYQERYFVTGVGIGGSEWYSDGNQWRVEGGQVILSTFSASDFASKPTYTGTTTTSVTIRNTPIIPAGLLKTGYLLSIDLAADTPTAVDVSRNFRAYLSTSQPSLGSTPSGANLNPTGTVITQIVATTGRSTTVTGYKFSIESATTIKSGQVQFAGTSAQSTVIHDAAATVSNLDANNTYLSLTCQCASAASANTITLHNFTVTLKTG